MLASLKKFFTKTPAIVQNELTSEIAVRQNFQSLSSYFSLLPDPDPILKKIGKDVSVYADLRNDSHVFSVEQQRKSGVLEMDWQIARNNAQEDKSLFVENVFQNLNVYNLADQMLNSVFFGMSVFEIVWEKSGNYLIPARIEEKPREWFFFNEKNELRLRSSLSAEGIALNPYKFFAVINKPTYANPYGERALSRCFWPVTFKRGGIKFWVTFTEKFGMPYLIGKLPRGLGKEKYDDLKNMLDLMVQDACAVIPDDASVDIKDFQRSASADVYERLVSFMNSEISKAILTQTLTTEVGNKGSYAASSTQADMRESLVKGDKRLVENAFNNLIALIYAVNFGNAELPVFEFYLPEDVDKTLAERDEILTRSGVTFTKEYFIKNYNLAEEDFTISEPPAVVGRNSVSTTENQSAAFASPEAIKQINRSTDQQINRSTDQQLNLPDKLLQMQIEQTLKPVLEMVQSAETFEEISSKLAELYPDMDTSLFESLLTKALFYQELNGRANAGT